MSYVQRRNLDDFPTNYHPALEFFFKIDILLYTFQANITTLSAEKRVRNYSEFTRKRVAKKTGP